jgi:hypothetical protein
MEALVICKAPMENIKFDRLHAIQIALQDWDGYKAMTGVDEKSAPRETRLVVNRDHGNAETGWSDCHELKERLEPSQHAERIRRR